jgi:hypothetical protein
MLLVVITDEELFISQIVKAILLLLLTAGIIYNAYRIFRQKSKINLIFNIVILLLLSVTFVLAIKEYRVESALLKHSEYVVGTTKGYCSSFARGEGIEFEYQVNGTVYRNCNTFHPISKDSIIVVGGKYMVRYSREFPELGRMNFRTATETHKFE